MTEGWTVLYVNLAKKRWRFWGYTSEPEAAAHAREMRPLLGGEDGALLAVCPRYGLTWDRTVERARS